MKRVEYKWSGQKELNVLFLCDIIPVKFFCYFSFSDQLLIISVQNYSFPIFSIIIILSV